MKTSPDHISKEEVKTLPKILDWAYSEYPNNVAFVCDKEELSYTQLHKTSCQIAQTLKQIGIQKGDRVGIYLHRSLEVPKAVYGILRSGAAYVPLDPFAPPERTKACIQDCGIRIIVTNNAEIHKLITVINLMESGVEHIIGCEPSDWSGGIPWGAVYQQTPDSVQDLSIRENDLSYILYTSGSTGKPKGIVHTHKSGLAFARITSGVFDFTHYDRIAICSPLHFDQSNFGYFSGPLSGSTTIIVPEAHLKLPASLSKLLEEEHPSVLTAVPSIYLNLLEYGALDKRKIDTIRLALYSGEPFPVSLLIQLMEMWPETSFTNSYGPTELSHCTYFNLSQPPYGYETVPIGKVWSETEMLIVDDMGNISATGKTGELLVHSTTLMKEYWNLPDLTQKAIFTSAEGRRYYRTGDLVNVDSGGNLVFLGRKDRQVKVRGNRIELDEIEVVLQKHPAVKEAAVFTIMEKNGVPGIAAIVCTKSNYTTTTKALSTHIKNYLPSYFVPNKITLTPDIPRNANGKVDYALLQNKS